MLLFWAVPGEAAYRVTGLQVAPAGDSVTVTLEATAAVSYSYFTMDEGEPRLVVDLADAVHDLPKYRFQAAGTPLIMGIRTSQYRPYPEPAARIVLDLPMLMPFQIKAVENQLIIRLSGASVVEMIPQGPVKEAAEGASNPTDDLGGSTEKQVVPQTENHIEPPTGIEEIDEQTRQVTSTKPGAEQEASAKGDIHAGELANVLPVAAHDSTHSEEGDSTIEKQAPPLVSQLFTMGLREPVSYSSGGRRDPFVELPAGQQVELGRAPLADVEKLSIVGILWDVDGYRALAQDVERNAYVFRKGDPVLYGSVTRIEEERVIFRLYRRGLDRTIILKLPQ
ncbi:AMIN domain-containing protein [Candidatus Zixiibacteriota bacterium]